MQTSRRARELTQWSFVVLLALTIVAFLAWPTPLAVVLAVAALAVLVYALAQARSRRSSRR